MSILLFLSRIYDKEAPSITLWSLGGEVHYLLPLYKKSAILPKIYEWGERC